MLQPSSTQMPFADVSFPSSQLCTLSDEDSPSRELNSLNAHSRASKETTEPVYGDGTYFARDASYSDGFARTLATGQKQMLLVNVIVGRWTAGQQGMKVCPTVPGEQYIRFNSLVNTVADPTIFVVQASAQAYPTHLITYH